MMFGFAPIRKQNMIKAKYKVGEEIYLLIYFIILAILSILLDFTVDSSCKCAFVKLMIVLVHRPGSDVVCGSVYF